VHWKSNTQDVYSGILLIASFDASRVSDCRMGRNFQRTFYCATYVLTEKIKKVFIVFKDGENFVNVTLIFSFFV